MVKEKIKIQVNISKEAQKEIEELKEQLNLSTYADVIRSSLKLSKYLELEKKAGNEVIIRNKNTGKEKEIVFIK
ncbi:MAG: hypothetical protein WC438_03425 [Candidatus Pacearchaeota archaeon]